MIMLCMALFCITVAGCGKEKVVDEESSQVIQISLPPVNVTPTPDPEQVSADAVATNGNLTMVNGYLTSQEDTDTTGTSGTDVAEDNSTDMNTDNNVDTNTDSSADDSTDNSDQDGDESEY